MRFGPQGNGGQSRIPVVRAPYNGDDHVGGRGQGWNQGSGDRSRNRDRDGGRDRDGDRHRRRYRSGVEFGLEYGYPGLGYGYLGWPGYPFLWSDPDLFGHDAATYDSYDAPYAGANQPDNSGYADGATQYQGYPAAPAPYNSADSDGYAYSTKNDTQGSRAPYTGSVEVTSPPLPQQSVTVVFNDGRPSEQIHNYLITPTTLTVLDQKYREIPLDQINLAATQKTNRADGVDFRVPTASR